MSQLDTLPEDLRRALITGYKVTLAAFKVVLCESKIHIEPKKHSAEHWYTQALDEIGGIFVEELKPHVPGISWRKTETSDGDLIGAVIFCTQMADDGQIRTVVEYVLPAAFLTPEIRTAFAKAGSRGVRCLSAVEGSTVFKNLVGVAKP
jgi:hypothetical protein